MKRWLMVLSVLLLVVVLLAACLPALVSTGWGRGLVLKIANREAEQRIDISDLALAWKGPQRVEGLSVSDPDGRPFLSVSRVTLGRGLLDLIRNSADLGMIEVIEPTVRVYPAPPTPERAPPPTRKPARRPERPVPPRKPEKPPEPTRIPPLYGEIVIKNGSLLVPGAAEQIQTALKDLEIHIKLDGLEKPIEYAATLQIGEAGGRASLKGTATLPPDGVIRPLDVGVDATLEATDCEIAPLAALAAPGETSPVGGVLNLRAKAQGNLRDGLHIQNRANVAGLELPQQRLALGTVELALDGRATLESLVLTEARLRSDFLTVDASGTYGGEAGAFSARVAGDLEKTSLLLSGMKVLPEDVKFGGRLQADLSGSSKGRQIVIEKNEVALADLVFTQGGKTFRDARVTLNQQGTLDIEQETARLAPIVLRTSFADFRLAHLDVAGWSKPTPNVNASGTATLDIGRALESARDFAGLPAGLTATGQVQANLSAGLAADEPGFLKLESTVTGLRVRGTNFPEIGEDRVVLNADVKLAPDFSGATVERLALAAAPLSLESHAAFEQKGDVFAIEGAGTLRSDLAKLSPYLAALGAPAGLTLAGQFQSEVSVNLRTGQPGAAVLEALISGLRLKATNVPEIVEQRVLLKTQATVSQDLTAVNLKSLALESSPLNLSAEGSFQQAGGEKKVSAKGHAALDLDRLSAYIQALAGTNIALKGKSSRPFEIATAWKGAAGGEALKNANATAAFQAEAIDAFGLHVKSLDVPLEVKSGVASVDIRAQVNQGTLALQPSADFRSDKPALTLPPKSTLLSGLQLTPELADQTFGLIHPIFKGATSAGGTVSLFMDNFSWPLAGDAKKEAAFAGRAEFRQVHLASSGLLIELLSAIKAREREVTVLSTNVNFSCRDGRIASSPLTLGVGRHQISLVGSVGLDQTLDYQAQVPLTEELVGSQAAKYLSGTTVKIPIRGTASKPELNLSSLNAAVADLAAQAARKALEEKAGELIRGLLKQ